MRARIGPQATAATLRLPLVVASSPLPEAPLPCQKVQIMSPAVVLSPRPLAIGVGHPLGALATIYPLPHDIPMDWIVTGDGAPLGRR